MLDGELTVIGKAWEFQKEAGICEVPVSIEKYLNAAGADLKVRFDLKDDEAGQTFQVGERHIIVVNGRHSPERQRFTILHELAHIRLKLPSSHQQTITVGQLLQYVRRPREEILCDVFASECLLPKQAFRADVLARPCAFASIQELAERYEASLTATGSRFAAYSEEPCSWILADQHRVRFVSHSPELRARGLFIRIGIEVPSASVLGKLSSGTGLARTAVPETVPAYVWSNAECRGIEEFTETAVLMPSLNQGVSLLVAEEVEDAPRGAGSAEEVEDELLRELDGQLKFPGRRSRR
jgi:hypothetical protein